LVLIFQHFLYAQGFNFYVVVISARYSETETHLKKKGYLNLSEWTQLMIEFKPQSETHD
jgi:hypothetical protein